MQTQTNEMNLLLIADNSDRAAMLKQSMELQGISCMLRRVDPGNGACAYVRRTGLYRKTTPPDLILFDFSDADPDKLPLLKSIAFGPKRAAAPVVVLTSVAAENALKRDGITDSYSTMFAPTELSCFLSKMKEHRRRRFMRALDVMYQLGPVLVRMPRSFSYQPDHLTALSA